MLNQIVFLAFFVDFNYSKIKWDTLNCDWDGQSEAFLESCNCSFLVQHVDFPTRIAGKTLRSNNDDLIDGVGKLDSSDHTMYEKENIL